MATVIRGGKTALGQTFSFADVNVHAERMLAQAQAQAQALIAQARVEAERQTHELHTSAFNRGLAEGREEARTAAREAALAEARQRLDHVIVALTAGLDEFEQQKRRLLAIAESGVIELALAIARRVCKTLAGQSTEPARANARRLLDTARHEGDLELLVNPAEAESLKDVAADFIAQTGRLGHVKLTPDESIQPGGCTLRTRTGTLSADIDDQIQRIAAALLPTSAAPPQKASVAAGEAGPA
jgi:flagellar assembly protein FliH